MLGCWDVEMLGCCDVGMLGGRTVCLRPPFEAQHLLGQKKWHIFFA